jgi:hypothetical protein
MLVITNAKVKALVRLAATLAMEATAQLAVVSAARRSRSR